MAAQFQCPAESTAPAGEALPLWGLRSRLTAIDVEDLPAWTAYLPAVLVEQAAAFPASLCTGTSEGPCTPSSAGKVLPGYPGDRLAPARPGRWWVGRVWNLSRDNVGCRELQEALEDDAVSAEDRVSIVKELHGHISEAVRCRYANYVVQKCIQTVGASSAQFIVDELSRRGPGAIAQVARHKYGCRIIQRLLESLPEARVRRLSEGLLVHGSATCFHPYGNYAMQHLIAYGTAKQRSEITRALAHRAREVAENRFACAVVSRALEYGDVDDQALLVQAVLKVPRLLDTMTGTHYGRSTVRLLRQAARDCDAEQWRGHHDGSAPYAVAVGA